MVERKRRFLVRVINGNQTRKLAVMVSENATIEELSQEIISTLNLQTLLILEVSDGFELRGQDHVSIIGGDEIVTARPMELTPKGALLALPPAEGEVKSNAETLSLYSTPPPYDDGRVETEKMVAVPKRFQIRLVNARLARQHAAQRPRDITMPRGTLAFGGTLVSGNTSLWAVKNEAAKLFQWSAVVDEQELGCNHDSNVACSCTIAQRIEQYGVASMLHCQYHMMGRKCSIIGCSYSHKAADVPSGTSSCSLCWERLESPCPKCKTTGIGSLCPLMQNAGCQHWNHAHCLQGPLGTASTGCPRGCRKELYPREAVSFIESTPHILLIWDGDKVDRLMVPERYRREASLLRLSSASVQNIVEQFLRSKNHAVPNLGMRIHQRDPITETVSFYNNTIVSVCPLSAHSSPDRKWFSLFPELNPTGAFQHTTPPNSFLVDLHTAEAPIATCGCTTIGEIFSDYDDSDCVVLYVTKRRSDTDSNSSRPNKEANYLERLEWHPEFEQSTRGISSLLSTLFILSTLIPKKGAAAENYVLATFFAMCRFPPAVRTLGRLLFNKVLQPWEKGALSEALFFTLMDYREMYDIPHVIKANPRRIFEVARPVLAQLYRAATTKTGNPSALDARAVEEVSVTCPITQRRLQNPTVINGVLMETSAYALYDSGGELSHLHNTITQTATPTMSNFAHEKLHQILLQSRNYNARIVEILNVHGLPNPCLEYSPDLLARELNFAGLIDEANLTDMKVLGPLDLNSSRVVPPQLVLDERGYLAILTGQACGVTFLMPMIGEQTVDPQRVAQSLEPCIKAAKDEGTWEIDAFDQHGLASRTPDEAIMICLDLSGSMNGASQVVNSKDKNAKAGGYLTRLQLMVELFNIFVNRASSFNSSTSLVIGLITFSSGVKVVQNITAVFENFLQVLKDCKAYGYTPLYDALDKARQLLVQHGAQHPAMRKRIIVVSDGEDTSSSLLPWMVASRMYADGVVVDSVQVGTSNSEDLHAISACTGGYRFCPNQSLEDALCIFDLETILDSGGRPGRKPIGPSLFSPLSLEVFKNKFLYPVDLISVDNFPKRAEHPKMNQAVVPAKKIENRVSPNMRLRRIMTEIRDWNADPHPAIDIYVNDEDITFMKFVLEAPSEDCPYSGGTFLLTCQFPEEYPRNPPEIRFVTFILHPNVSKQGKICVAELGRLWTSDITMKEALGQIYGLLLEPDLEDPTETHATLKYYDDDGTYALAAANAVKEHALKTRGEWKRELDADSNVNVTSNSNFSLFGRKGTWLKRHSGV
ncbi:hypothetical protein AX16_010464 [Volvariella volvacea WC 439]|nr:hypothetical protein AX16_010464 [Volvariella volvacea WC 439]